MKFLTYAAAIALFSASPAFAQGGPSGGAAMPSNPPAASSQPSDQNMGNMGNMNAPKSGGSHARHTSAQTTPHHTASRVGHRTSRSAQDARENEITARLNQEQLRGGGGGGTGGQSMNPGMNSPGMSQTSQQ